MSLTLNPGDESIIYRAIEPSNSKPGAFAGDAGPLRAVFVTQEVNGCFVWTGHYDSRFQNLHGDGIAYFTRNKFEAIERAVEEFYGLDLEAIVNGRLQEPEPEGGGV